ncbi:MAG: DNA-protecting protein DprA [Candidatus Kerfeldbacteria bacterium]|nr:DNA-protecting protein DprA [Candidatus Kerfeldbacteria bacterium]
MFASIILSREQFPALLHETPVPPNLLYIRGNAASLQQPSIAIVGSRAMTPYGAEVCRYLTEGCVRAGLTIVSGLATGIDAVAHETALACHGQTIAVLGCGTAEEVIFPAGHRQLARRIIANGGALVSEYPDETAARRHHFIARNRILAGLSLATVVVEAADRSGAINTAHHALESNRLVFAVPSSIFSARSRGCHRLIQAGAILVQSVEQIIAELQLILPTIIPAVESTGNPIQQAIIVCLQHAPAHVEQLVQQLGFDASVLQVNLTELEIQGIVRKNIWMMYEISHR